MSGLRRTAALARKDLLVEWRGREATVSMLTFSILITLLLGFVMESERTNVAVILWVALSFAAMLGVIRPVQSEVEEGTLEALLLYPGDREHIFWGKWAAMSVMLATLLVLLLPVVAFLFNVDLWRRLPVLTATGLLAIIGIAAVGTLLAALALQVRGRELLMPLLVLPVALPVVLAAVRASEAALSGLSPGPWLWLLVVFDALFLLVCPILFESVVEG